MRQGKTRIIIGAVLTILQIMSIAGNAKTGSGIQISFSSLGVMVFDLIYLASYWFIGVLGVIILVSGIMAYLKGDQEEPIHEKKVIHNEPEELPGFNIPLSITMPILIAIFVVILTIVLVLEKA